MTNSTITVTVYTQELIAALDTCRVVALRGVLRAIECLSCSGGEAKRERAENVEHGDTPPLTSSGLMHRQVPSSDHVPVAERRAVTAPRTDSIAAEVVAITEWG